MRKIRDCVYGEIPLKPVSLESGGTSGDNSISAINALGGFHKSSINRPGGPLGLTASEQISPELIDYNQLNLRPNIKGSEIVELNSITTFVITNYDIGTTYLVEVIGNGSVSILNNTITYNAPSVVTISGDGFIITQRKDNNVVSSRTVNLQLSAVQSVNKPSITAPINNKTGIDTDFIFTSTAFSYQGEEQTHASSDWEIATSADFGNSIVFYTANDPTNKTIWQPGILKPQTVYYVRIRHTGSDSGYSLWSNIVKFTTGIDYPKTLRQQLRHSDPEPGDFFGWNVMLSGDNTTLAVAAPNKLNPNVDMAQFGSSDFVESFGTNGNYVDLIKDGFGWYGAVELYSSIYACSNQGDVYVYDYNGSPRNRPPTYQYPRFGQNTPWTGIATRKNPQGVPVELWACAQGTIASWWSDMGDFYGHPNIPDLHFRGMCIIDDDIYLCVYNGAIYSFNRPDPNSLRTFSLFHNENAEWSGVYNINGTLYATTYGAGGRIFKFEGNVSGGKIPAAPQTGNWTGLVYHHGTIFACTHGGGGHLYVQVNSEGDFVQMENSFIATWIGMFVANDEIHAVIHGGHIYRIPWNTKGILGGRYAGAVYVFKKDNNTWTQQAKLVPNDSLGWDCFGCSLSMSHDGNTLLAWSPRRYTFTESNNEWHLQYPDQGKAYVFTRTGETWSQETVIDRPDPKRQVLAKISSSAAFGSDGALWNCTSINEAGTILVVVYSWELFSDDANVGIRKGYVYVYAKIDNTWTHRDTITIEDQSEAARSLSNTNLCPVLNAAGDVLYLGVPGYDRTISGELQQCAGKVDIYTYNGTTWDKSVSPVVMTESINSLYFHACFGIMLKVNRNETKMFVTTAHAQGDDIYRIFVFEKNQANQWVQSRRLGWITYFNHSAKIDIDEKGYTLSAGTPFVDAAIQGQAEVFKDRDNDWSNASFDYYLLNPPQQVVDGDLFGYSTALNSSGDTAFVGSPGNNMISPTRNNVGKVYIYSK